MTFAPAVGLGLLFVFLIGAGITYVIADFIVPILWTKLTKKPRVPTRFWNSKTRSFETRYELPRKTKRQEKTIDTIATVGGIVAVLGVFWFMIAADDDRIILITVGVLTLLGFVVGALSFALKNS